MVAKAQGQIWWANLPDPLGWRPVLIRTRDDALPKLLHATVAPLSRTMRDLDSEVILEPADGVPSRSAGTLDNCWRVAPRTEKADAPARCRRCGAVRRQ